jgi:hypothetical protein
MPSSSFDVTGSTAIDAVNPGIAYPGNFNTGLILIGQTKTVLRRSLTSFDVFGVAAEDRPLLPNDVLLDARLDCNAIGLTGPGGFACTIDRIARLDWDYLTADWNHYRAATSWTSPGGDVATPPAAVAYASPSALGEFVIAGVLPFVADAIANRGGKVRLRHKADDETTSHHFVLAAAVGNSIRLKVTYEAATPAPIDRPTTAGAADALIARPGRPAPAGAAAQPALPDKAAAGGR